MSKPYFEIDHETQNIIMELKNKCMELNLGNISFEYFDRNPGDDFIEFFLAARKNDWDLVVKQRWAKTADIYQIEGDRLNYQYSEADKLQRKEEDFILEL